MSIKLMKFTCTFEEFELDFLGNPLSIPNSAKKLDDFGGDTWLITCGPPEVSSVDWTLSTYSKRDPKVVPPFGVLLLVEEGTGRAGSSGF